MASQVDYLSGKIPSVLRLHLCTKPFPSPFQLTPDLEADFAGYQAADLDSFVNMPNAGGTFLYSANATFNNLTNAPVTVTGSWVTATPFGEVAVFAGIVALAGTPFAVLPPGESTFSINFMLVLLPEAG